MYFEISLVVIIFRRQVGTCTLGRVVKPYFRNRTYVHTYAPSSDVSQGVRVTRRPRTRRNVETSCRCGTTEPPPCLETCIYVCVCVRAVWSVREHKGSREINSLADTRTHTHMYIYRGVGRERGCEREREP